MVQLYTCFILFLAVVINTHLQPSDLTQSINKLYAQLNNQQYWNKNQQYVFPIKWEHKKGIYESRVHFNYVDARNRYPAQVIRDDIIKIDDINMFVTNFVLYGLLEGKQLGTIDIDQHKFSQSLDAINDFRDKNTPEGIPQYTFWKQIDINGTWVAYATNLLNSINVLPVFPEKIANFLARIGLGFIAWAHDIAAYFIIPPDMDDSSVNLALLAYMKQTANPHYQFWNSYNLKKQQFYDKALKYAYRPFSPNKTLNSLADEIDPRTYFALHKFLQRKAMQSENPSLILPTTWIISYDEQTPQKVAMPFNVNNVDATVSVNFLFGLCYQVLVKEVKLNEQLRQMMLDTTDLLVFTITQMLKQRPTLILVYYPSKFDFYWFVARTVHLLKRYPNSQEPIPQILQTLEKLMKDEGTTQILEAVHHDKDGNSYWAEFLGNYAKKQRNEDSFFSTSLALNALLDTWTTREGSKLTYDQDTPVKVKEAINSGIDYLVKSVKQGNNEMNAFFSGSVKNMYTSMPYFYPSNRNFNRKNPYIDPQNTNINDLDADSVSLVKGFIQKQKYEEMIKMKWYGYDVPLTQMSLNDGRGMLFPFWSSPAITQIMSITALSKAYKLSETLNLRDN